MSTTERLEVTGHYAGAATRAAGAALDVAIVLGTFTLGVAALELLARVVFGASLVEDPSSAASAVALAAWAFVYMFTGLAIAGRTPGQSIVGLRVVSTAGFPLSMQRAFWRTLAFPLSALPLGLGYLGIVFQREHRALHDVVAGTVVVYDWGERPAELPGPLSEFLARRAGNEYTSKPMVD